MNGSCSPMPSPKALPAWKGSDPTSTSLTARSAAEPAGGLAAPVERIDSSPLTPWVDMPAYCGATKDTMRISLVAATVLALVMLQSGCSQLPERPSWAKWNWTAPSTGLPSPDATIAASDKKPATKVPAKQSPQN